MKRRTLLSALGTAGFAPGCAALGEGESEDTVTPAPIPSPPETRVERGPQNGSLPACSSLADDYQQLENVPLGSTGSRFEGLGCPSLAWADRTVCHHRIDVSAANIMLLGGDRLLVSADGGGSVSFTLFNRSDQLVTVFPDAWSIVAPTENGWKTVVAKEPVCRRTLRESELHRWRIGIGESPSSREDAFNVTAGRTDVEPGTYLLLTAATVEDGTDLGLAAPFEVDTYGGGVTPQTPSGPVQSRYETGMTLDSGGG